MAGPEPAGRAGSGIRTPAQLATHGPSRTRPGHGGSLAFKWPGKFLVPSPRPNLKPGLLRLFQAVRSLCDRRLHVTSATGDTMMMMMLERSLAP